MKRVHRWFIVLFSIVLVLIGCQQKENSSTYLENEDRNAKKMVSNNDNVVDRENNEGVYILDQNPNLLNNGNRSDNYGKDIDKAKSIINDMEGYRAGPVWINGDNMWVTVYRQGMLSHNEKIKEEGKLHRILTGALPRYDIEVTIREDRS